MLKSYKANMHEELHPILCICDTVLDVILCACACDMGYWATGVRGLMRCTATLPQGNQQSLVVTDPR